MKCVLIYLGCVFNQDTIPISNFHKNVVIKKWRKLNKLFVLAKVIKDLEYEYVSNIKSLKLIVLRRYLV
jgi:hypothetical protein